MSASGGKKKWRVRASDSQKSYVLEFMEKHPQLVSRNHENLSNTNPNIKRELWNELTEKLNDIGHACKTVDTWQKYWRDQRAFVKERHAAYMRSCKGNSRNLRNRVKPLNDYEKRVFALITTELEKPDFFVVEYVDSDNEMVSPKLEIDDEYSQLESLCEPSLSSNKKCSPPSVEQRQSPPTPPTSTSSSVPKIKSIRSLMREDEKKNSKKFNGNQKRVRLGRELERKTIALLEKNEEFNREMEIKKLQVEKEKVEALKELVTVVRLGFACIAGQQLK